MSELLRVLVVDDEEPARALLREHLAALATSSSVELAGECANGFEAVRVAATLRPDLLLLDVQMPKLDGFEVLELLAGLPAIFVTAHDEHALRAFEVNAVDYLLKPVARERLAAALERARGRLRRGEPPPDPVGLRRMARIAADDPAPFLERLLVREGDAVTVIPIAALDHVEARDDDLIMASRGKKHRKQQTLGELESQLDPRRFVRIHRSYLLNIERLARIELYAKDSRVAVLLDGSRLPVSRAGHDRLRQLLGPGSRVPGDG